MNCHLYHQVRSSAINSSDPSRVASSYSSMTPVSSQICYSFNADACTTSPCPSGRIHQCQNCNMVDVVSMLRNLDRWQGKLRDLLSRILLVPTELETPSYSCPFCFTFSYIYFTTFSFFAPQSSGPNIDSRCNHSNIFPLQTLVSTPLNHDAWA